MVVLLNLCKEWISSAALIVDTIRIVLEVYDKPWKVGDKMLGEVPAKLLISKATVLPSHILLPNWFDSTQPPYS